MLKSKLIALSLVYISYSANALDLDCDGKVFRGLESDKDVSELRDPGGLMQMRYNVSWSNSSVTIKEDQLEGFMSQAALWSINRKDLTYSKTLIKVGADSQETTGQCKIWEKPADNAI